VGDLFNKLQKFHEQEHTVPALQDTLFTALQNELFDRHSGFSNHHDDEAIIRLRQEQTMLGWGQLFRGRFSCRWPNIQQKFLLTLVVDCRYSTGNLWVHKLINLLWRFMRSLWDARNLDRHGHTPLQNQDICRNHWQSTVQALYASSPMMLAADRYICKLPIQTQLQYHAPDRIALWIQRAKPIVTTSIREASKTIQHNFHSITAYFTRAISPTLEEFLTRSTSYPSVYPEPERPPLTKSSLLGILSHIAPLRSMPLCMAPPAQVDPSRTVAGDGKQQRLN
jgi:hypothetical protein